MEYLLIFVVSTFSFLPVCYKYSSKIDNTVVYLYFILPSFLLLVLFIGLRKEVGIDYHMYYNMFHYGWGENKEFGFRMVNTIAKNLNLALSSVLIFMSTLSIYFVFKLIINESKYKLLSFVLFWLDGGIIFLLNVMRQGLTNFIFLNLIGRVRDGKYLLVLFLLTVGCFFHYSMLLALLFIPLLMARYSRKTLLMFYSISIFLMLVVDIPYIVIKTLELIPYFGEIYLNENLVESLVFRRDFGLGYLFRFLLVLATILFYDKILADDEKVKPYLNAFIWWGILKILTLEVWVFERFLDYLRFSSIIVIPHLIMIIKNQKIKRIILILIFLSFLILYLKSTVFSSNDQKLMPYQWIFNN